MLVFITFRTFTACWYGMLVYVHTCWIKCTMLLILNSIKPHFNGDHSFFINFHSNQNQTSIVKLLKHSSYLIKESVLSMSFIRYYKFQKHKFQQLTIWMIKLWSRNNGYFNLKNNSLIQRSFYIFVRNIKVFSSFNIKNLTSGYTIIIFHYKF